MRRALLTVSLWSLLITGAALAEGAAAAEAAPAAEAGGACSNASFAAQLRAGTVETLDEIQTVEPADPSAMGGTYLPCPTTSNCVGGANKCRANPANCAATGSSSSIDFGSAACELPSGSLFKCKGGRTVHLVTTQCEQCPC